MKIIKLLLLLPFALVITGFTMWSPPTPAQLADEDFAECPYDYKEQIMTSLNEKLFDPSSAKYGFSEPTKYVYNNQFVHRVIVGVKAKNRSGEYGGDIYITYVCFADDRMIPYGKPAPVNKDEPVRFLDK